MSANWYFSHPDEELFQDADLSLIDGTLETDYGLDLFADFSQGKFQKPTRFSSMSGKVRADLGSNTVIEGLTLWHNARGGESYHIKCWRNGTNPNVDTPTMNVTVVMPTLLANGFTRKVWVDLTSQSGYDATGFRYVQIEIPTLTLPSGLTPGLKAWGWPTRRSTTQPVRWSRRVPHIEQGIRHRNEFNAVWSVPITAWDAVEATIHLTSADETTFENFVMACRGGAKLAAVVPYTGSTAGMIARYIGESAAPKQESGVVQDVVNPLQQYPESRPVTFALEDATAGLPEWE